jgi:hypothetical protein
MIRWNCQVAGSCKTSWNLELSKIKMQYQLTGMKEQPMERRGLFEEKHESHHSKHRNIFKETTSLYFISKRMIRWSCWPSSIPVWKLSKIHCHYWKQRILLTSQLVNISVQPFSDSFGAKSTTTREDWSQWKAEVETSWYRSRWIYPYHSISRRTEIKSSILHSIISSLSRSLIWVLKRKNTYISSIGCPSDHSFCCCLFLLDFRYHITEWFPCHKS